MAEIHEGGCLCGAVRYRVAGEPTAAGVCHCNFCRRGTYFTEAAVEFISGARKTYEYRLRREQTLGKVGVLSNLRDHTDIHCRMGSGHSRDYSRNPRRPELDQAYQARVDSIGSALDGLS
jgi:hypothetical protein